MKHLQTTYAPPETNLSRAERIAFCAIMVYMAERTFMGALIDEEV
ncbi:hypothetical protein [Xanthocytophaga flava]|nr:hypothetical protein [Xanthocytophaga flavus]